MMTAPEIAQACEAREMASDAYHRDPRNPRTCLEWERRYGDVSKLRVPGAVGGCPCGAAWERYLVFLPLSLYVAVH